jgi:hypothetical protein
MLDMREKVRAPASVEARPRDFSGHDSDNGNPEFEPAGEKMSKKPHAPDTAGARDVIIVTAREPGSSAGSTQTRNIGLRTFLPGSE